MCLKEPPLPNNRDHSMTCLPQKKIGMDSQNKGNDATPLQQDHHRTRGLKSWITSNYHFTKINAAIALFLLQALSVDPMVAVGDFLSVVFET